MGTCATRSRLATLVFVKETLAYEVGLGRKADGHEGRTCLKLDGGFFCELDAVRYPVDGLQRLRGRDVFA